MTTIRLKAHHYAAGTSYVPRTNQDRALMQHCLNTDLDSLNKDGKQKLEIVAMAHGWEVVIE